MSKYTSMMKTAMMVLVIAGFTICPDVYVNKCYEIIGNPLKKASMMVNTNKNFIPNVLGIALIVNGFTTPMNVTQYQIFMFLREIAERCDDSLPVPNIIHGNMEEMVISGFVFWGAHIAVDKFSMTVRQGFPKQTFLLPGFLNAVKIPFSMDPEVTEFIQYANPPISWSSHLTNGERSSQLCLRRYNSTKQYFLSSSIIGSLPDSRTLDRYNYLLVNAFSDIHSINRVQREKFLAEIYQCGQNVVSDVMHVVVDDSIQSYEIRIVGESNENPLKMKFRRNGKSFVQETSAEYSQDLLSVTTHEQDLTAVWWDRANRILLHPRERKTGGPIPERKTIPYFYTQYIYRGKIYFDFLGIYVNDEARKLEFSKKAENDLSLSSPTTII